MFALIGLATACSPAAPKHVLLVSIDSLRADRLGAYGYPWNTSPHIDSLARGGVLFERAVSSTSWTLPAHVALFTGLSDRRHGVQNPELAMGPEVATLAELLDRAGFDTAAVVSGPYLHPKFGLDRGFAQYMNCMSYLDDRFEPRPPDASDANRSSHRDVTGPCVVGRAREWMARHRDEPWFLFLHFWDVHYDYRPPPRLAERFRRPGAVAFDTSDFPTNPAIHAAMRPQRLAHLLGLYDAEVAFTDEGLGEVLSSLADLGLDRETLVIVTSDHGDAFFEHGRKGHQFDLHAEVVTIPLVMRGPGVPTGVRLPGPAHITDLAPTILDLVGVGKPPSLDGRSLVSAFTDPSALADRWVLSELRLGSRHHLALESRERKVIRNVETGETLVYDLGRDPGELRPTASGPELSTRLEQLIEELDRLAKGTPRPLPVAEFPPELLESLRDLGYLD